MSEQAIGLADARRLQRRALATRAARGLVAAGAILAAAVALVAALRDSPARTSLLPGGSDGIVVLDVSSSIATQTHRRVALTLERLAETDGRYGLVLFSDTAYQALPPRTPARELRAFARLFRVRTPIGGTLAEPPPTPWAESFSAGTRISTGLALALDVIDRERLGAPAVLLISDLDAERHDVERVARVALEYRRRAIPLRVVGLDADPVDEKAFAAFASETGGVVATPHPRTPGSFGRASADHTAVAATAAAAALLALFVLLAHRLRWSAA